MIHRRAILLLLLITGILFVNLTYNHLSISDFDKKSSELKAYVQTINSIDINNNDFSDLTFLDTIIGNKQIVLLGEQLHSDGSTFMAKSRLIRYLHEKHNFNVVLYEASLHDLWVMDQQAKDSSGFQPKTILYPFWWDNEECRPLWQYYNKSLQSTNPITLGGFDIQYGGLFALKYKVTRAGAIKEFLSEKQINIKDYPAFNNVVDELQYTYMWEYKRYTQSRFDSIQTDLLKMIEKLPEPITVKDNIFLRYLKGIHDYGQLMWDYNPGDMPRMNMRDSLMADNLIWQIDSLYNQQKVIIWLANVHLLKSTLQEETYQFTPLGKYIKDKYPDSYMMAFTSYAATSPDTQGMYYEAGINSLENILHSMGYKYSYLDINNIDSTSFMNKDYFSVVNQRINSSNAWSDLIDGLFYIDINKQVDNKDW